MKQDSNLTPVIDGIFNFPFVKLHLDWFLENLCFFGPFKCNTSCACAFNSFLYHFFLLEMSLQIERSVCCFWKNWMRVGYVKL